MGALCLQYPVVPLYDRKPRAISYEPIYRLVDTISKRLILGSGLTVAITAKM